MGLSTDLLLACNETNRAGGLRIYVAATCGITSMTAGALQDFVSIAMDTTADVFYRFDAEFETKGINVEGAGENGTPTFTNVVEFKFLGLDKTKLKRLQDLIDERKVTVVFETANSTGTYKRAFVIGWDNIIGSDAGANPNANLVIEPAIDGENSATVILTAKHAELMRELVGTIETNSDGTVSFGS
jgi:hypothetical protein